MAEFGGHAFAPARSKLTITLTAVSEAELSTVGDALEHAIGSFEVTRFRLAAEALL
jgi:hypothetical protein